MNRKQIAAATTAILEARLNYLEAVGGPGIHFREMSEFDTIREELDNRSNAILDALSRGTK